MLLFLPSHCFILQARAYENQINAYNRMQLRQMKTNKINASQAHKINVNQAPINHFQAFCEYIGIQ